MLQQAQDFREECEALNEALLSVSDADMRRPTQFKSWTIDDVLGHLHLFDVAARITLENSDALRDFFASIKKDRDQGATLVEYTRRWLGGCQGGALRERWFDNAMELSSLYAGEDPRRRVAWGGPDMSVRSCISARQMECWSHGQAVFDLLGLERVETERIRNIAVMGINTFGWSFANRGEAVPEVPPVVRLVSPSGSSWEWHLEQGEGLVEGSAVEFCQVVAQTRNVADTGLQVVGESAVRWMEIAQCFAGPPESPPAPGSRRRSAC